jgi:AraC-like DNA-binding protein
MSTALAVRHGRFGRATLYQLNRPMTTHAHREGHLVFHVEGAVAEMAVHGRVQPIAPGAAAAVSPWEPHDFRCGDGAGGLYLVLYIKPVWFLDASRMAQFALRFGQNAIAVADPIRGLVMRVTTLLLEAEPDDLFDGYLFELTRACFDQSWQWTPGGQRLTRRGTAISDFRVRRSIRLMQETFAEPVELEAVARRSGLSRPHFFKLFKRQMGITPNLFLNTLRMESAIDRLTGTDATVTDIGCDLGFSSQASFTRFFTSNVGIPPTDYRRVAHLAVH